MRVIQDSDDELEEEIEVAMSAPKAQDARDTVSAKASSNNTSSTESLKPAIEDAHRNHLQSHASQNEPQSSVSLPEHPSRVTNHLRTSVPVSMLQGSESQCSPVMPWRLEGTMRDDYARHDPQMMFPDPSSTVPNATMTQRRIMEGVVAQTMLGLDFEAGQPHYMLPPEASVPFSDILQLSSADNVDHVDLFLKSSNLGLPSTDPVSSGGRKPRDGPNTLDSFLAPQPNIAYEAGDDFSPVDAHVGPEATEPPTSLRTASSYQKISEKVSGSGATTQSEEKKRQLATALLSEDDDLIAVGLPKEQYQPRPSRSRSLKVNEDQVIDYSARPEKVKRAPKRRKTTGNMAVTPELQSTPQKVKQICAMGFTPSTTERALIRNNGDVTSTIDWLITNANDEDELAPRSSPKMPPKKTRQQIPSLEAATLDEIMRGLSDYRRDEPNAVMANGTTTQPQVVDHEEEIVVDNKPSVDLPKSPKVQVVIPCKSPKTEPSQTAVAQSKKAKRKKSTPDQAETIEVVAPDTAIPETEPEKKRGRGRPKKTAKTSEPTEVIEANVQEPSDPSLKHEQPEQVFHNLCTDVTPPAQAPSDTKEVDVNLKEYRGPVSESRESTPAQQTTVDASSTRQPGKSAKTTSQSPKSKDKVPYRVGLSKRARIAPLLRIVKK